jgi:hypothetical protein
MNSFLAFLIVFILIVIVFNYLKHIDFFYYFGKVLIFIFLFNLLRLYWNWENDLDAKLYAHGFDDMAPMNMDVVQLIGGAGLIYFLYKVKLR